MICLKRRASPLGKFVPNRRFGNNYYYAYHVHPGKGAAKAEAKNLRSRGYSARVTKFGDMWMVWARGGPYIG